MRLLVQKAPTNRKVEPERNSARAFTTASRRHIVTAFGIPRMVSFPRPIDGRYATLRSCECQLFVLLSDQEFPVTLSRILEIKRTPRIPLLINIADRIMISLPGSFANESSMFVSKTVCANPKTHIPRARPRDECTSAFVSAFWTVEEQADFKRIERR